MAINRSKRIKEKPDLTPKNLEEIFVEYDLAIPTEKEFRTNIIERKTVGTTIPEGQQEGEIRIDDSQPTKRLVVRIGKKMYKVDLVEIT